MSPLFERTLVTKFLAVGYQNETIEVERLDPSGQGINISRALHHLGCNSHAVVLLGNDLTASTYRALVLDEGFGFTSISVKGSTPSRTCILDIGNKQETLITTKGASISENDVQRLSKILEEMVTREDIVVFAGQLPPGAPIDTYTYLIDVIHAEKGEAILITGGEALSKALDAQPEMVALTQIQCESIFNFPIRVEKDLLAVAHKLREKGVRRVLLEMKGMNSALLVSGEGQLQVELPDMMEGTTSGIWEALLAGFLSGRCLKGTFEESMEIAAAAAAYAGDEVGVEFGSKEDVNEYRDNVEVHSHDEDQLIEK
jgi:fructose-1-phosphate kinase PfkB-like protein